MTTPNAVLLALEVQNGFEQPKQMDLLTQELNEMSSKLEETTNWTEEDELIVHAFEGEFHALDGDRQQTWVTETIAGLSTDYPDLVFALNVTEDSEDGKFLRREYYLDGGKQVAIPHMVVPDANLDGVWEVIVEDEESGDSE